MNSNRGKRKEEPTRKKFKYNPYVGGWIFGLLVFFGFIALIIALA